MWFMIISEFKAHIGDKSYQGLRSWHSKQGHKTTEVNALTLAPAIPQKVLATCRLPQPLVLAPES